MKPDHIILEGITGSKAYGLDTETSDTDIKGVYIVKTENVLKLNWNYDKTTKDHVKPDWVYHEIQKFMKLASECNPTILELLFLENYTVLDSIGKLLVENRHIFLSNIASKKYYGYAFSQIKKLATRGVFGNGRNNRYEKHARHCYRLLYQGKELLETGTINVRVKQEVRDELFKICKLPPNDLVDKFILEKEKFDNVKSILPDKPDYDAINSLLIRIRKENYGEG